MQQCHNIETDNDERKSLFLFRLNNINKENSISHTVFTELRFHSYSILIVLLNDLHMLARVT